MIGNGLSGLRSAIGFAGHQPFEHLHVPGKVRKNSLSCFFHEVLEIGTDGLGGVLLFGGLEKAGFDSFPASLVSFKGLQAVSPRLGSALEDAG